VVPCSSNEIENELEWMETRILNGGVALYVRCFCPSHTCRQVPAKMLLRASLPPMSKGSPMRWLRSWRAEVMVSVSVAHLCTSLPTVSGR
jgi:hypothetical protein